MNFKKLSLLKYELYCKFISLLYMVDHNTDIIMWSVILKITSFLKFAQILGAAGVDNL